MFSCTQQSSIDNSVSVTPADIDSLCIKDTQRAKRDILKGKTVFCMPIYLTEGTLRQEKQLIKLCEKYKLVFDYEPISDCIVRGQTDGCYIDYMDKIIASKYGVKFKERLLEQADSILLASNDTIKYYFCDKKPRLLGKKDYEDYLTIKLDHNFANKLTPDNEGKLPFIDVGFYIDTIGNPSGYFLDYFCDNENKDNSKYKDELWKEALVELSKYKHWVPGTIKGHKVMTEHNIRIYFTTDAA